MKKCKQTFLFDFHDVFLSTKRFIDAFNETQDSLTTKLNSSHRGTAEYIIRLYLKQLNRASEHFDLYNIGIPGFKTFNSSLAKLKGCTSRTVINHKERLKQAGFIVKEKHLGAQGVELYINPEVLMSGMKTAFEIRSGYLRILPNAEHALEVKTFHPLVHEHQEQNNNNSIVDKLGVRQRAHSDGQVKTMPTGTLQEQKNKNTRKNAGSTSIAPVENGKEVGRIFLINFINDFWEFARKILFPEIIFSDPEMRDIKNMIWVSVYHKFPASLSDQQWVLYQKQAFERVVMVRKWLDKSPHHWIPKPHIYFSPNNDKNGFQHTIKWLLKRDILKLELQRQLALQKIIHEQKLHDQGKGRNRTLSRLQLYRLHEQRVQRMDDPVVLEAYYATLTTRPK